MNAIVNKHNAYGLVISEAEKLIFKISVVFVSKNMRVKESGYLLERHIARRYKTNLQSSSCNSRKSARKMRNRRMG